MIQVTITKFLELYEDEKVEEVVVIGTKIYGRTQNMFPKKTASATATIWALLP